MKKNAVLLLVAISILSMVGCSNNPVNHPGEINKELSPTDVSHNSAPNKENNIEMVPGKKYRLNEDIGAKIRPEPTTAEGPVFIAKAGQEYAVVDIHDPYAQIKSGDQTGWIPIWYFTTEAEKIKHVEPFVMLVQQNSTVFSYPGEVKAEEAYSYLTVGKVVLVLKEYNDWFGVDTVQYDYSFWGDQWVPKDRLAAYDPHIAKEGKVKTDAIIYDQKGIPTSEKWNAHALILGEISVDHLGTLYEIQGAGGQHGFIKMDDFIPNPFEYR